MTSGSSRGLWISLLSQHRRQNEIAQRKSSCGGKDFQPAQENGRDNPPDSFGKRRRVKTTSGGAERLAGDFVTYLPRPVGLWRHNMKQTFGGIGIFLTPLVALTLFSACGTADFATGGSGYLGSSLVGEDRQSADGTAGPGEVLPPETSAPAEVEKNSVSWSWPCGSVTKTDTYPLASVIAGSGVFLTENEAATYSVQLTGEICDGADKPRDVLFVLDASASMKRNDPQKADGSCGRLEALRTVAEKLSKQGVVRFGLITFSRASKRTLVTSGDFFPTLDELTAAVSAAEDGESFADIICDDHHLGTNYNAGFGAALDLVLAAGNPDARTDILMVSDGKPTRGHDGAEEVAALKQLDVAIATVVVDGKAEILKDEIASPDGQCQPLHADIAGVAQLADALVNLSAKMQPAASLAWRKTGDTDWNTTSVVSSTSGTKFTVVPFDVPRALTPAGIEVEYTYRSQGQEVKATGSIRWKEVAAPSAP
jgi:hypothetical protein